MIKGRSKTEYKYVYKMKANGKTIIYLACYGRLNKKSFPEIKDAAIQVDKWLIQSGLEPVNILKRKSI